MFGQNNFDDSLSQFGHKFNITKWCITFYIFYARKPKRKYRNEKLLSISSNFHFHLHSIFSGIEYMCISLGKTISICLSFPFLQYTKIHSIFYEY